MGLSPKRRRLSTPPLAPDEVAELAAWRKAGDALNAVTGGPIERAFGLSDNARHGSSSSSGTRPLDASHPVGEVPMVTLLAVDGTLTAIDRERLIDNSVAGWGI